MKKTNVERVSIAVWLVASLGAGASPIAVGHHSYAMFDQARALMVSGRVAKVEWKNPHTYVWVYVKNDLGQYVPWGFESGSVGMMTREGWSKQSVKVDADVVIHYFPLKDGRVGGQLVKVVLADGTELFGDRYVRGVAIALGRGRGVSKAQGRGETAAQVGQ